MKTSKEIEQELKKLKPRLQKDFFVTQFGYFGSFATGEQSEKSDLDILVEFSKPIGWKFFTLESFLEDQLKLKIDLVTKNALREPMKDKILQQVKYI